MFKNYKDFITEMEVKYRKNEIDSNKIIFSIVPNTSDFPSKKILEYLKIPFEVNYFEDKNLENKFNLLKDRIVGIIIHGGPLEDMEQLSQVPTSIIESKIPKLGICLGLEVIATYLGCKLVKNEENPENAHTNNKKANIIECKLSDCELFSGIGELPNIYDIPFNHKYRIDSIPKKTKVIASTVDTPIAGFHHPETNSWCVQFGLGETVIGDKILSNFYHKICLK